MDLYPLHHGASRDVRRKQCYAGKFAQFPTDSNVESGGVNSGLMAAVSNVKSIHLVVSGGVQPPSVTLARRKTKWMQTEFNLMRIKLMKMP